MKLGPSLAAIALISCLAACTSVQVAHIHTSDALAGDRIVLTDHRVYLSTGLYVLAEGNIYTCWYGIKKMDDSWIDPPRMTLLKNFLANELLDDGKQHQVGVMRFEIYWNRQNILENHVNSSLAVPPGAGAVGGATFGALAYLNSPHGPLIGCKDAQRGEYYLSESPDPESAPVIVYLDLVIDGKSYGVRSVYPFIAGPIVPGSDNAKGWISAAEPAINQAFEDLANEVHPQSSAAAKAGSLH